MAIREEDAVEALLDSYLDLRDSGEAPEFDQWVVGHPDQAVRLREAFSDWLRGQEALETRSLHDAFQLHIPHPGDRIGEFELLHKLGQGGQAIVWEARQERLSRFVALKVLDPRRVDERALSLFRREASAGARIPHPSVVRVLDSGEDDGFFWIAQELVPGGRNLRDRIEDVRREPRTPRSWFIEVARLVRTVAEALQAAHDLGVIHRDVKPQNILLTPDGEPRVGDFGLAALEQASVMSRSNEVVGTYMYMSPEQVRGVRSSIDHRTDVFSLGIVLYELLTSVRPFEGDTAHQICSRIVRFDPPEPRAIRSQVPRDLSTICGKALEKDPRHRYSSMRELALDLGRSLEGHPIVARRAGPLLRLQKWARREPVWSVALSIAVISIVSLAALGLRLAETLARARRETENASRQAEDVFLLSLSQFHEDLVREADELWPPFPALEPELRDWIRRAQQLVDTTPRLEARKAIIEASGFPARRESTRGRLLEGLDESIERSWWSSRMEAQLEELRSLVHPDTGLLATGAVDPLHGWSVARRLEVAERLSSFLEAGSTWARRWREALPLVRACYPDVAIAPQVDLLPIGPDPSSGLWEFWHVATGAEPRREEDGRLRIVEASGIVFVLLPGGSFEMGAQAQDAAASSFDPGALPNEAPVHRVDLGPFFLAKHELTQAQWRRLTGSNPSQFGPDGERDEWAYPGVSIPSATEPVEQVSWLEARRVLRRIALDLPSEAQWEYAARAGSTRLPLGSERVRASFNASGSGQGDPFVVHAPVGSFPANAFGLHDLLGNVAEWCLDSDAPYREGEARNPVRDREEAMTRIVRGGCWNYEPSLCRPTYREENRQDYTDDEIGLRAMRLIEAPGAVPLALRWEEAGPASR